MKRRKFLKSALSIGGLSLSDKISFALDTTPQDLFVLRIHCDGGWDVTSVFNNKLDSDFVDMEANSSLATGQEGIQYVSHPNRPSVDQFFSTNGARSSIVNGIFCKSIERNNSVRRSLSKKESSRSSHDKGYLQYYAERKGSNKLAPFLCIDAPFFPGTSKGLGKFVNADLINQYRTSQTSDFSDLQEELLDIFIQKHYRIASRKLKTSGKDSNKIKSLIQIQEDDNDLGTALVAASDASFNATDTKLVQDAKLALTMFQNGHSLSALVQSGNSHSWDSYRDNFSIQSQNFEQLFSDLNSITNFADSIGISDQLMILVTSDSGRAPTLNANAGKNRWPYTSALAWGKFIRPGSNVGITDEHLRGVNIDPIFGSTEGEKNPISIENIIAAVLFAAGVNYKSFIVGHEFLSLMLKLR